MIFLIEYQSFEQAQQSAWSQLVADYVNSRNKKNYKNVFFVFLRKRLLIIKFIRFTIFKNSTACISNMPLFKVWLSRGEFVSEFWFDASIYKISIFCAELSRNEIAEFHYHSITWLSRDRTVFKSIQQCRWQRTICVDCTFNVEILE